MDLLQFKSSYSVNNNRNKNDNSDEDQDATENESTFTDVHDTYGERQIKEILSFND